MTRQKKKVKFSKGGKVNIWGKPLEYILFVQAISVPTFIFFMAINFPGRGDLLAVLISQKFLLFDR